jgi:deoxyribose-phosphate aldolase
VRYLVGRARAGVRVKASGGISSAAQAVDLLDAGAVLLGTSSGVAIVTGGRGGGAGRGGGGGGTARSDDDPDAY